MLKGRVRSAQERRRVPLDAEILQPAVWGVNLSTDGGIQPHTDV